MGVGGGAGGVCLGPRWEDQVLGGMYGFTWGECPTRAEVKIKKNDEGAGVKEGKRHECNLQAFLYSIWAQSARTPGFELVYISPHVKASSGARQGPLYNTLAGGREGVGTPQGAVLNKWSAYLNSKDSGVRKGIGGDLGPDEAHTTMVKH